MPGGSNAGIFQIVTERVMTYSHGAGGDYLAKFGLFSMMSLPVHAAARRPELNGFNLADYVPAYDTTKHFMERTGLAIVLGHCQALEPENAFRDWADVSEMIQRYPQYFLTPELALVPAIMLEKDNSHGVQDISCRFGFVVFCLLHNFDYGKISSQEAGYSLLHRVEGMQGALGRRISGQPFTLPLLDPQSASEEELTAAMKEVLRVICERANGATFKAGGGCISAFPARANIAIDFEWRPSELASFLEAAKKGQAKEYDLKDMPTFPSYRELLLRAWNLLNATGPLACTKLTAHTFQFKKNPVNPLCAPVRGPQAFRDFLNLFGGWTPQPRPAPRAAASGSGSAPGA